MTLEELKTKREELIKYSNITLTNIRSILQETRKTYINTYKEAYVKFLKIVKTEKENEEYYNKMSKFNIYILSLFENTKREMETKLDPLNIELQKRANNLEGEIQNAIKNLDRKIEEKQNKK